MTILDHRPLHSSLLQPSDRLGRGVGALLLSLAGLLLWTGSGALNPAPALAEDLASSSAFAAAIPGTLSFAFGGQSATEPMLDEFEGQSAVSFEYASLEMRELDGERVDSAQFENKTVVVYIWSIYCRSCVPGARRFQELKDSFAGSDVEFLSIHLFEPHVEKLLNALAELGLSLQVLQASSKLRDELDIRTLPTALVFNKDHQLTARFDGSVDSEGLRLELRGSVEKVSSDLP